MTGGLPIIAYIITAVDDGWTGHHRGQRLITYIHCHHAGNERIHLIWDYLERALQNDASAYHDVTTRNKQQIPARSLQRMSSSGHETDGSLIPDTPSEGFRSCRRWG